jgi:hypothetical protein
MIAYPPKIETPDHIKLLAAVPWRNLPLAAKERSARKLCDFLWSGYKGPRSTEQIWKDTKYRAIGWVKSLHHTWRKEIRKRVSE